MKFTTPTQTIFYSIERAIKEYRKFGQKNIHKLADDITLDQAMVLFLLAREPELSQKEMAALVFKDVASLTRMIELMVKNGYLERTFKKTDRRQFQLSLTTKGKEIIHELEPVITTSRQTALEGLTDGEIEQLNTLLQKIISNCNRN